MYTLPPNTWLYQLAMTCYLISYISWDILVLRFVLATASVFLFVWGFKDLGGVSVDTCAWNGVFFCINLCHGIYLLWQMRPVKFRSLDYENIHAKFFKGALSAMTSKEFQLLSSVSLVRELRRGSSYADHGNKPHSLSILVSGKMEVCNFQRDGATGAQREVVVNVIQPFEFIDSPQWISRNRAPDQVFLVTLRAAEDCRFIMWPMETLEKLFKTHPHFKTHLECVVGCDVAEKLMQLDIHQQQAQQPQQQPQSGSSIPGVKNIDNSEPPLAVSSVQSMVDGDSNCV